MIISKGSEPAPLRIEFGDKADPVEAEGRRLQMERARRNSDWLQSHWAGLLPQARGKFVAVAGAEGMIAETPEDAWAWVRQVHPEDDGAIVQFIRLESSGMG
jgi:hypothetical protein